MKWPFKPWMGSRQKNAALKELAVPMGRLGGRANSGARCRAKGQRLLDTRREPSRRLRQVNLLHLPIDSPTEESTLIRPVDPQQSLCWFFPSFSFFSSFFWNGACCTPQAPLVDSNYTAWHDGHSVGLLPAEDEGGVSSDTSYRFLFFFYRTSEGDCCLDGAVCVGGGGDQQLQDDMPATTWLVTSVFIFIFLTIVFYIAK